MIEERSMAVVQNGDQGIEVSHQWCGPGYVKVYSAPAGLAIEQHRHKAAHDAHLLLGAVDVTVDGVTTRHEAPAVIHIEAGKVHGIVSVTEFLWACVWPDVGGLTDPDDIDHEVIA